MTINQNRLLYDVLVSVIEINYILLHVTQPGYKLVLVHQISGLHLVFNMWRPGRQNHPATHPHSHTESQTFK